MAKGKRTYIGYYSTTTGNLVHVTNINERNFSTGDNKFPVLRKYNPKTRQHEVLKAKKIKKG
ncbi:hypothetical protein KGV52_00045 [Candidatus Gracilibacteria bacterium]|nr:hypothetical protein [Candidatus Gracilibacteria bacterium]